MLDCDFQPVHPYLSELLIEYPKASTTVGIVARLSDSCSSLSFRYSFGSIRTLLCLSGIFTQSTTAIGPYPLLTEGVGFLLSQNILSLRFLLLQVGIFRLQKALRTDHLHDARNLTCLFAPILTQSKRLVGLPSQNDGFGETDRGKNANGWIRNTIPTKR